MFDAVSNVVLWRVIVILAGILYGTIHHYEMRSPEDLNWALSITLLLFLAEQFVEIGHKLDKSAGGAITRIPRGRGIFAALLKKVHEDISNTIRPHDDGFTVANPAEAIASYAKFWELLNDEQQKLKRSSQSRTVFAIHSCEVDIWVDHALSRRLLDLQEEFHGLGGKITRVLCGRGKEPDEKFCRACANMRASGIHVKYFNTDSNLVDHTWGWDFLYISETGQSVVWSAFARAGGVIAEATYINTPVYNTVQLADLWGRILSHATDFPGEISKAQSSGGE
jgi:hypothetical protein